jgi:Delta7-sterol 5-desaturase
MEHVITKFIEAYISQIFWYAAWTIPAFLILWVIFKKFFAKRRIQENKKADKTQFLRELKNSLLTIIVFTAIDLFVFQDSMKTMETATFKVYSSFTEHGGIPYIIFITFLLFVVEDTYFYWMHRMVHSPKLYKYIHKVHHESIDTTPFTSYSFHPIEAALEIVPMGLIMIIAYFFPVHILALFIWQILSIALNVLGHSGYELFPSFWNNYWFLKWKLPSTHHNMHHEQFNGNYGLYFIWWDRMMGTEFPDYEEKFKSIFERKSKSKKEKIADTDSFAKVKAVIKQKEFYFNVEENEILLDAALRQNIEVPYLCRRGICGTCIANCTNGTVVMEDKKNYLTNKNVDKSKILMCQSKAVSENITIEINS